jgi:hypothetical protein
MILFFKMKYLDFTINTIPSKRLLDFVFNLEVLALLQALTQLASVQALLHTEGAHF